MTSFLLALALLISRASSATQIETFSDEHCQDSYRIISGPNGYPNGTCILLESKGNYSSFQVVGLDPGCQVTIYGPDSNSDPCSSTTLQLAEEAQCYGSSWKYYSINRCHSPQNSPAFSSLSASTLSSTTRTHSTTSTGTDQSTQNLSDAGIIGISVGTALGLITIAVLVAYVIWRRRKSKLRTESSPSDAQPAVRAEHDGASVKEKDASEPVQEMHSKSAWEMEAPRERFERTGGVSELPGTDVESNQR